MKQGAGASAGSSFLKLRNQILLDFFPGICCTAHVIPVPKQNIKSEYVTQLRVKWTRPVQSAGLQQKIQKQVAEKVVRRGDMQLFVRTRDSTETPDSFVVPEKWLH